MKLMDSRSIIKKDHNDKVKELCDKYNLDYKELSRIPYQELYSKLEFLLDNNMPLQIDGELNPIFNMSSLNMKAKYGITKEEVIELYYLSKLRREM